MGRMAAEDGSLAAPSGPSYENLIIISSSIISIMAATAPHLQYMAHTTTGPLQDYHSNYHRTTTGLPQQLQHCCSTTDHNTTRHHH